MSFKYEFINSLDGEIKVEITFDEWSRHKCKTITVDFDELARAIDDCDGDIERLVEDSYISSFEELGIEHLNKSDEEVD